MFVFAGKFVETGVVLNIKSNRLRYNAKRLFWSTCGIITNRNFRICGKGQFFMVNFNFMPLPIPLFANREGWALSPVYLEISRADQLLFAP